MTLLGFLSAAARIAAKDLKVEFRRAYEIISILTFSVSSILICSFAWGGAITTSPEVTSAALWIILFFASVLIFTTSFSREVDRGTLGGLKTLPCSPTAIFSGKTLYVMALLLLVECVMLPVSFVFLNLKIPARFGDFLLVFLLGVIDLSIVGSFVSALVMFSEGKNLLLSFLLFPISVPVLIPSVLATVKAFGNSSVGVYAETQLLMAFLLTVVAVAHLTFKFVFEE